LSDWAALRLFPSLHESYTRIEVGESGNNCWTIGESDLAAHTSHVYIYIYIYIFIYICPSRHFNYLTELGYLDLVSLVSLAYLASLAGVGYLVTFLGANGSEELYKATAAKTEANTVRRTVETKKADNTEAAGERTTRVWAASKAASKTPQYFQKTAGSSQKHTLRLS
jgi:hypothetical protein